MRTIAFRLAGLALVVLAQRATAQELNASNEIFGVSGGMTIEEVAAIFRQNSLKATISGDYELTGDGWEYEFEVSGYNCNAARRCTEFLFTMGFDLTNGFPIEKINEWNSQQPAGRAFLDEDGDPFIDHTVSISGPDDEEAFWEGLLLWLNALSDFDEFIDKSESTV